MVPTRPALQNWEDYVYCYPKVEPIPVLNYKPWKKLLLPPGLVVKASQNLRLAPSNSIAGGDRRQSPKYDADYDGFIESNEASTQTAYRVASSST